MDISGLRYPTGLGAFTGETCKKAYQTTTTPYILPNDLTGYGLVKCENGAFSAFDLRPDKMVTWAPKSAKVGHIRILPFWT